MALLRCEVVEWVDLDFPGWVRVRVFDVADRAHHFVDKAPVFGLHVDHSDQLPIEGWIRCLVMGTSTASQQPSVLISTSPDHLESLDGIAELYVRPGQLADDAGL